MPFILTPLQEGLFPGRTFSRGQWRFGLLGRATILLFLWLSFLFLPASTQAAETVYRLGVPLGYMSPTFDLLFGELKKRGFAEGKNLEVVAINLATAETEAEKTKLRKEIAERCDIFFTTGGYLPILFEAGIQTPLVFVGISGPQYQLPAAMQATVTGFYRNSTTSLFKRSAEFLPANQRQKLALIYHKGSGLQSIVAKLQEACKELSIELLAQDFLETEDIGQVMRSFKEQGVQGVVLFPPAARDKDIDELVKWQNELKLPIIGQLREQIEQGILGGPTVDHQTLIPELADTIVKILKGRSPGQLPIKYLSDKYVVNLAAVQALGISIPSGIIEQAEIVGLATAEMGKKEKAVDLVSGSYRLGISINNPSEPTLKAVLASLAARGYVVGQNLRTVFVDLKGSNNFKNKRKIAEDISSKTNVLFVTGNHIPTLGQLPAFKTPICYIATRETAAGLTEHLKKNSTGVIRASFTAILEGVQSVTHGAKKIAMLGKSTSDLPSLINRYRKTADNSGITLDYRLFSTPAEVGGVMRELQPKNDCILLFAFNLEKEDLHEIIRWQDELHLPVLGQLREHVEAGLLGGVVIDSPKLYPKVAEYIDKLFQGRAPSHLPLYYYPQKLVVNIQVANSLGMEIPTEVLAQADIIR